MLRYNEDVSVDLSAVGRLVPTSAPRGRGGGSLCAITEHRDHRTRAKGAFLAAFFAHVVVVPPHDKKCREKHRGATKTCLTTRYLPGGLAWPLLVLLLQALLLLLQALFYPSPPSTSRQRQPAACRRPMYGRRPWPPLAKSRESDRRSGGTFIIRGLFFIYMFFSIGTSGGRVNP